VALSAAAGLGLAYAILAWIRPLAVSFVPRMQDVAIGPRILGYAALLLLLTMGLLGLLATTPLRSRTLWTSLGSARVSASPVLRKRRRRVVVAEVALAVFALVGSALVVRTLSQLLAQPKGFDPSNLLTFRVEPPFRIALDAPAEEVYRSFTNDRRRANAAFEQLTQRLEALSGVRSAGAINRLPLTGDWWITGVRLRDRLASGDSTRIPAYVRPVTTNYLQAMGTRLLRGRALAATDGADAERVLLVDAEFAKRIWGESDPIGREVILDGPPNASALAARVVGVVDAIHMNRLDAELRPTMYIPFAQALEGHSTNWGMDVVVRGATPPMQDEIRRIVRDVFPDAVMFRVATMESIIDLSTAQRRFQLLVLTFFGLLAVMLATIGIGGALMLAVRERHNELAVRLALGALPKRLWWTVQREGLVLAAIGCGIGIGAALASARMFSAIVYGISVRDPFAFFAAPATMLVAAFLAVAIPATRAARSSPLAALRE
jgi:predicted permease